jgi:hypothetical protein
VPGRQHLSDVPLTEDPTDPVPAPAAPPEDPLRRIAIIAAAVVVPVVVALVVLANVIGGSPADDEPADVGATPTAQRADLPPLPVEVPPVTPEAEAFCPALMGTLPLELTGELSRQVDSDSLFAYAWGEPPIVLVCGVERPAGFVAGVSAIQIEGVQWYVDTTDPDTTVWTTIDRPAYVEISLPASVDSAPVTSLSPEIAAALPYREPTPGG